MREYEITYLISDDLQESEITKITGKIAGMIADHKGNVLKEETWGRRKLAYPIQKQLFATYITVNFEMEGLEIKPFERDIFLMKEIIRHLLILKSFSKAKLELTADDIAKTEEIEKVVGGERSFEAVEGRTEESYELMQKREEATEITEETPAVVEEKPAVAEEVKEEKAEAKPKAKKTVKKEVKKEEAAEEVPAKPKTKKAAKPKVEKNAEDEADRLTKLNQEIEDILGDDL